MGSSQWIRGRAIGRGSTATVSLATMADGEVLAVKSAEVGRSQLLRREESFLAQLDCPRIVACRGLDVIVEGGRSIFNLFLEYADGGSLADAARREGGALGEAQIRCYARQILEGLAYLHAHRIVHCDIKPRNVLVGAGGAKIADLGCARLAGAAGPLGGTPMYMAPEVARGKEQGFSADVWAVGCTVVELASGRPPWDSVADPVSTLFRIGHSAESPEIPSWLSDEAKDFLGKCLRREAKERWSAEQLLKHPFVMIQSDSVCQTPKPVYKYSPKSVLDLDPWDSLETQAHSTTRSSSLSSASPIERIRQLGGGSGQSDWSWTCGGENWIAVRGIEESGIQVSDQVAGSGSDQQDPIAESSDCCCCSVDVSCEVRGDEATNPLDTQHYYYYYYYSDLIWNLQCTEQANFPHFGRSTMLRRCNRQVLFCSIPDLGSLKNFKSLAITIFDLLFTFSYFKSKFHFFVLPEEFRSL